MTDKATAFDRRKATASAPPLDLRRAVVRWLSDGRAQGHSERTTVDRQRTMDRFCWWLENEEESPATLDALDPTRIRSFLAYLRAPQTSGRWGTSHPNARCEPRPATVNAGTTQLFSHQFAHTLADLGSSFQIGFSQWMGGPDGTNSLQCAIDSISASLAR